MDGQGRREVADCNIDVGKVVVRVCNEDLSGRERDGLPLVHEERAARQNRRIVDRFEGHIEGRRSRGGRRRLVVLDGDFECVSGSDEIVLVDLNSASCC